MSAIIIDPRMGLVHREDILDQRPTLDVYEPREDEVATVLAEKDSVSLITGIKTWDESWVTALSEGDWITTVGAGYDIYPLNTFSEQDITFTHSPGVSAPQVAEHVFAMAFSFTRHILEFHDQQKAHEWTLNSSSLTDLTGEVCCIVGLGNIGEAVATRARAFGMTVRGVKRTIEGYDGAAHEIYPTTALYEALSQSRLVVLSVPLTEDTHGLIGSDELKGMASDAIVVNVARGEVLQTEPLLSALREEQLLGACLDVTDPEPLPSDSPLWSRDDVLITPHCAGTSEKYADRFVTRYLEQYDQWQQELPMRDRVV